MSGIMESVTSNLIAFITARLDEDERTAQAATPGPWTDFGKAPYGVEQLGVPEGHMVAEIQSCPDHEDRQAADAEHIARHDPARVLRELEAKRGLLAEHEKALTVRREHPGDLAASGWVLGTIRALKLVALTYADHPDYQAKWAP